MSELRRLPATCRTCGRGNLHLVPGDQHLLGLFCYESAAILAVFMAVVIAIFVFAVTAA